MISPAFFMASMVGFHVEFSQAMYSGKCPYSTCRYFTSVTGPSVYWRSFWASASRVSVSWARASGESEEAARHMDKIIVLIIFYCDGEPIIPQVHYYHDNSTICARLCYSSVATLLPIGGPGVLSVPVIGLWQQAQDVGSRCFHPSSGYLIEVGYIKQRLNLTTIT